MPTVYLVRHAISQANVEGILAGRTPGIGLAPEAQEQLEFLRSHFSDKTVDTVVSSPLLRAQLTAEAISMDISTDSDLDECDYGTWSNRSLKDLSEENLWADIQRSPSGVQFPKGERMVDMQLRAIRAVERWRSKANAVALVSHGDVIKSIISHFSGIEFDDFQGIRVPPASVVRLDFNDLNVRIHGVLYSSHGSEIGGGKRG